VDPIPRLGDTRGVKLDVEAQRLLALAHQLALEWHADQTRKGSDIPYISHLSQVKGLVLEHGGSVDQAVAALLHDCLEDAPNPRERAVREAVILREFGEPVLEMVHDCTDTRADEAAGSKAPWKERKQRYLEHLEELHQVHPDSVLVAACDKRHNLHALVWDIRTQGPGYLARFNAEPHEQLWYFEGILRAVRDHVPERLRDELAALLREFAELLPAERSG